MKSTKKEYYLQAKRKAYDEANHSTGTGIGVKTAITAEAQPEEPVKKVAAVKVTNKSQKAKVSEVEVAPVETARPEAAGNAAN